MLSNIVIVGRMCMQSTLLAMLTMKRVGQDHEKSMVFYFYAWMWLCFYIAEIVSNQK